MDILVGLSKRTDVVLPNSLKRAEQCLDEENFEKLSKKIKIDWLISMADIISYLLLIKKSKIEIFE